MTGSKRLQFNRAVLSLSDRLNERSLKHSGATDSVIPVIEYPKSGGTWIAKMIAAAIGLPYLDDVVGRIGRPCVIRTHWRPSPDYERAVYVVRDIRDIFISLFHHRERNAKKKEVLAQRYFRLFGESISLEKFDSQFALFIEHEMTGWGGGVRTDWNIHMTEAHQYSTENPNVVLVKYEEALLDTQSELCRVVNTVLDFEISAERAGLVEEIFSARNQVSLSSHREKTFFRKGQSGEWRTTMPKDAGRLIAENYNENLVKFGYESDQNWWRDL